MEAEEKVGIPAPQQSDRRKSPRYDVDEGAMLLLVNHGSRIPCTVIDLSLSGCRLRAWERFRAGSPVRVEVSFTIRGISFRFGGVTQWIDSRHLLGIRFVDVIARRNAELAEALGEIEEALAAKARKQSVHDPTVHDQAALGLDRCGEEKPAPARTTVLQFAAQIAPVPRNLLAFPSIAAPKTLTIAPPAEPKPPLAGPSLSGNEPAQAGAARAADRGVRREAAERGVGNTD